MSFLAPLFLAAIGAVSLPILLHLIRRTPRGRVLFSSLMFLSPTPPRLTKRSRVEHWLLLLLRALAVCLIALAFARPFLWEQAAADSDQSGPGRRIAILVDTSASMRREDLWTQARRAAEAALAQANPTDSVTLMSFDRTVRRIVPLEQWTAAPVAQRDVLIRDGLQTLSPRWAATNLGDALIAAADALSEGDAGPIDGGSAAADGKPTGPRPAGRGFTGERIIVLISDMQGGGDIKPLDSFNWPAEVQVKLAPVAVKWATNAGLAIVADREDAGDAGSGKGLRLRVSSAKDSARDNFTLTFEPAVTNGSESAAATPKPMDVYVPPGESRMVRTGDLSAWWSAAGNAITLAGDDHPFDNRVWHSTTEPAEAVVVYIGGDDAKDTQGLLYYLERAFPATARRITRIIPLRPPAPLPAGPTDGASLFVLGDGLPADRVAAIRKRAEDGATVLVALRSAADAGWLATLLDVNAISVTEAPVRDYAMLSEIDFKHPLFAPFADPRFGDFTKTRFWKHRALDAAQLPAGRVIARFDSGAPAIIESRIGSGRCLVMTAGWHPADGQFALSSKFVPLLNVLLDQSLGQPASAARLEVGDPIDLAWLAQTPAHRGKAVKVTGPDGKALAMDERQRITATDEPGIYAIAVGEETMHLAVNLAARESETAPLAADELEKRGVKLWQSTTHLAAAQAEHHRQMRMGELENKHKIWRWLIVAALGVLMIETFVAGRFSRSAPTNEAAT
jgi:hypothetical protein